MINKLLCFKIGCKFGRNPISFVALLILLSVSPLNDSLVSRSRPRCFQIYLKIVDVYTFLFFIRYIYSFVWLFWSELNYILQLYAQSFIFNESIFNAEAEAFTWLVKCHQQKAWHEIWYFPINELYQLRKNKGTNNKPYMIASMKNSLYDKMYKKCLLKNIFLADYDGCSIFKLRWNDNCFR